MARYISRHKKPTLYERELLTIMQEECAEIIVQISKALRFGLRDGYPGGSETNRQAISREIGDFSAMVNLARTAKLIDDKALDGGYEAKLERLKQYMQTTPETEPRP